MPKWLDTTGNAVIAIFICDRCKMKRAAIEAMPDPNFPGLKVCTHGCADQKDPYRLPARKTERILYSIQDQMSVFQPMMTD